MYLTNRPRRLRKNQIIRDLCSETTINKNKLIMPYFILEGTNKREAISSMPGIDRVSIDTALKDIEHDHKLGIHTILLFGIPANKDSRGTEAYNPNGVVQQAVRAIKKSFPNIVVITDICLCEYTDHGHCGLIENGEIKKMILR